MSPEEIHTIAIHEAGHAVVMMHSKHFHPAEIIFGPAGGHVRRGVNPSFSDLDLEQGFPLIERAMICQAGVAANSVEAKKLKLRGEQPSSPMSFVEEGAVVDVDMWSTIAGRIVPASEMEALRQDVWSRLVEFMTPQSIWAQVTILAKLIEARWKSLPEGESGSLLVTEIYDEVTKLTAVPMGAGLPLPSIKKSQASTIRQETPKGRQTIVACLLLVAILIGICIYIVKLG